MIAPVDLRSDTVTQPTPEMRRAMADAEVGDDLAGEDPTVNRLQVLAAALLGTDAALFVPTGTMANQLAVRALAAPGTEIVCGHRAHVYCYEDAGVARNAGVQVRPVPEHDGVVFPDDVRHAFAGARHHLPRASLLVIENTAMAASGRPVPVSEVETLAAIARDHGARVHCDGARIWNAAIALGAAPRDLAAPCDTVMFCLSKGLSAPIGSLLCGPADVIAHARADRHRLGGGWRQAGHLAAAGIVALETMVERLADDHRRARAFAEALAVRFHEALLPEEVRTNIVCADVRVIGDDAVERFAAAGVLCDTIDAATIRFVFHRGVDDDALARAITAIDQV